MIDPESEFDFCIDKSACHAECYKSQWMVPADLPYFDGHFPGNPVLPAVAIIDATAVFLRCALKWNSIRIASIKAGKFVGLVLPGLSVEISAHRQNSGDWLVEWRSLVEGDSERLLASVTLHVLVADDHVNDERVNILQGSN